MLVKAKKIYNSLAAGFVKKRLYLNTYMNLTDNTHLEIENCKRIIELNDIYVRLKTSTVTLQVWGEDLRISDYNTAGEVIDGRITSIEFDTNS